MKRRQRVREGSITASSKKSRSAAGKVTGAPSRPTGRRWRLKPSVKPDFYSLKIADFYRPLKKPVTLRLDADVIAWFKKDGRRYQTRINAALRKVMEKEMKGL